MRLSQLTKVPEKNDNINNHKMMKQCFNFNHQHQVNFNNISEINIHRSENFRQGDNNKN